MKKSYRELNVNERINLKSNLGLGEVKREVYKFNNGRKAERLWHGAGAMLRLNRRNQLNPSVTNLDHAVDYSKAQFLFIPQILH